MSPQEEQTMSPQEETKCFFVIRIRVSDVFAVLQHKIDPNQVAFVSVLSLSGSKREKGAKETKCFFVIRIV